MGSGGIVKTGMAPIERVKLLLQTQDSNAKIISGEIPRYTGIMDCFNRVKSEQGMKAFWRGNLVNCIRYAPQQGSALAFNDAIKRATPKFNPKTDYYKDFGTKLLSGGLAGAAANVVCYPFDFARTRLASDVGSGKKAFDGIIDCIWKTVKQGGITGLYRGAAITCAGAFVYRGGQLGLFGQIMDMNPYKADKDSEKPAAERLYRSWVHCTKVVLQKEGLVGMYKGVLPEMVRGIGGPLVLTAYDRIKLWLNI